MSRVVDLAVSLEVAEHPSEKRAPSFIDDLCTASSCVLLVRRYQGKKALVI